MPSVGWRSAFGEDYRIPKAIDEMVEAKYLRDTSHKFDAAPSFSAPLKARRWLRLWVEHPSFLRRRGGPERYRLEVTHSLSQEGQPWIVSNELHDVLPYMLIAIERDGFRMAGIQHA